MILPIPSEPVSNADFRKFYNKMARLYHYPECWDTIAYPTLYDAIYELRGPCTTCGNYLPAEDPSTALPPCPENKRGTYGNCLGQAMIGARRSVMCADIIDTNCPLRELPPTPNEEPKDNSLSPCCDCPRDESSCGFERLTCKAMDPIMEVEP